MKIQRAKCAASDAVPHYEPLSLGLQCLQMQRSSFLCLKLLLENRQKLSLIYVSGSKWNNTLNLPNHK